MPEQRKRAFVSPPVGDWALDAPVGALTFRAKGAETNGSLTAFESAAPPGEGPPFHLHVREDEAIYVLEGKLRVRLEDSIHEAPAGSVAFFPRGVPHTWQNAGETPSRIFVMFTPAALGMERFFESAARLPEGTSAAEAFELLAGDAGMELHGPPLAQSHPASRAEPDVPQVHSVREGGTQ